MTTPPYIKTIERLRKLVKKAYLEGFIDGVTSEKVASDDMWESSVSKKELSCGGDEHGSLY